MDLGFNAAVSGYGVFRLATEQTIESFVRFEQAAIRETVATHE